MHLALPGPSVRWKRHESVMNIVMGRGPKRRPTQVLERVWQEDCRPRPPSDQLSFPSVWREEMLSLP